MEMKMKTRKTRMRMMHEWVDGGPTSGLGRKDTIVQTAHRSGFHSVLALLDMAQLT